MHRLQRNSDTSTEVMLGKLYCSNKKRTDYLLCQIPPTKASKLSLQLKLYPPRQVNPAKVVKKKKKMTNFNGLRWIYSYFNLCTDGNLCMCLFGSIRRTRHVNDASSFWRLMSYVSICKPQCHISKGTVEEDYSYIRITVID